MLRIVLRPRVSEYTHGEFAAILAIIMYIHQPEPGHEDRWRYQGIFVAGL
jgi:hypothetical protein